MRYLHPVPALFLPLLAVFLITSCPGQPLSLVGIDPDLGRYRVTPDETVKATFNQAVDAASVNSSTFYITEGLEEDAPRVAGSLSVSLNTITFTPDALLAFGVKHRVWITEEVRATGGGAFDGVFPQTVYGNTVVPAPGNYFVVNLPNDVDDHEIGQSFELIGYNFLSPETHNPDMPELSPGISATEAWKFTTGRPDVLVAVIDNGLEDYDSLDLQRNLFLNRAELPLPRDAGGNAVCDLGPCEDAYDWNGDGRFNVYDYEAAGYAIDPTGTLSAFVDADGNGRADIGDLFELYPDGADGYAADVDAPSDANDFADDISGYDFMRKKPVALGMGDYPEGTHGEGRAKEVAGEANNGVGSAGVCPDCSVLVARVTYGLIEDGELVAQAIRYALDLGADVMVAGLGALNATSEEAKAIAEARDAGVLIITGMSDESSFHHSQPSIMNHVFNVKGNYGYFMESFCTGYGGQLHASAVGNCGSTACGRSAGAAALVVARGRELGYCATSDPGNPGCPWSDLAANEVKQILNATAEKPTELGSCWGFITDAPCKIDTWDRHQGYGRINLFKAMVRLEEWPPPPVVEILSPGWFQVLDPDATAVLNLEGLLSARVPIDSLVCEFAPGIEPEEEDFLPFDCAPGEEDQFNGALELDYVIAAMGGIEGPPDGPEARTFTVRVRAAAGGVAGEDRRVYALHADPDLMPGFPFSLADLDGDGIEEVALEAPNAPSIESHPALADLDGDGRDELIVATSNAFLHALRFDTELGRMVELVGYPIDIRRPTGEKDGIAGAAAIADVDGDGSLDIVIPTLGGYVWAFRGLNGAPLAGADGLIGQADLPPNESPEAWGAGNLFFSSPVLSDLDGDGYVDVVIGCLDQHVYAFSGAAIAAGTPARLNGWPVLAADPSGCGQLATSILGTVAVVDINGDGRPEVITGTSETCDEPSNGAGRLYAIHPDGNLHPGGPIVEGFPVSIDPNILGLDIPLPPLTTGLPGAPVAARSGSEVVIGTGTFFGPVSQVRVDTGSGAIRVEKLFSPLGFGAGATGAFGTDGLGEMVYAVGAVTLDGAPPNGLAEIKHYTLSWRLEGSLLAVAHPNDDFMLMTSPLFVDVDGNGTAELVTISGGHLIHAFTDQYTEAEGWPKFTYGWHMASPAAGDLDGDGLVELVAPVREGRIFAWRTAGPLCGNHPWPTYHHDNMRTGNYDEPIIDPRCP